MKISFRFRVALWYTVIVALSLLLFGVIIYVSVSRELNQNLNSSLLRVAESLNFIINKEQEKTNQPLRPAAVERAVRKGIEKGMPDRFAFLRNPLLRNFIGPLRPLPPDSIQPETEQDGVWSAVYEHILLNPKNYLIQIADTNDVIVWRSENLIPDTLPQHSPKATAITAEAWSVTRYPFQGNQLRLLLFRSDAVHITIGYPVSELDGTLNDLFFSLLITLPVILLISIVGGWMLAKYFIRPVEDITQAMQDITADNLSRRLDMPAVNDEIARLTETLNAMISRLEASFLQIQRFTGDASHELRTPLAILMGEMEVALRSNKTVEEYQQTLSSALEEVERLTKVVANLLELSRTETGQVQLDIQTVQLSELLTTLSEITEVLAEEKSITVTYTIPAGISIQADEARLYQAFLNIMENAVKYNIEGGKIHIHLEATPDTVVITVQDTGMGIHSESLPHIFDRFYRVDKARSQKIRGYGLGLALVKTFVEAHYGRVEVESKPELGTSFRIVLPIEHFIARRLASGRNRRV